MRQGPILEYCLKDIPPPDGLTQMPLMRVTGIYFLWRGDRIVYVGQSVCIQERICQHIQRGTKDFDGISHIVVALGDLDRIEQSFIRRILPEYNRCPFTRRCRNEQRLRAPAPNVRTDRDVAAFLGLTEAQFDWLNEHPDKPRKTRIPRKNVRRWNWRALERWSASNPELLERARAVA